MPHVYEKYRRVVLEPRFIRVAGMVQNQDGIVHLKAEHVEGLVISAIQVTSHDFHDCCCFTLRLFALNLLLFHTFSTAWCKFDKECSKGMHVLSRFGKTRLEAF